MGLCNVLQLFTPNKFRGYNRCRSYGTKQLNLYEKYFFKIKVRAVDSVYFVGMDFNPSTIDSNLWECRRYGI